MNYNCLYGSHISRGIFNLFDDKNLNFNHVFQFQDCLYTLHIFFELLPFQPLQSMGGQNQDYPWLCADKRSQIMMFKVF